MSSLVIGSQNEILLPLDIFCERSQRTKTKDDFYSSSLKLNNSVNCDKQKKKIPAKFRFETRPRATKSGP